MTVEYRTIRDAAEAWVREMNAIPQGMIEKLMGMNPDGWTEITKPAAGDTVSPAICTSSSASIFKA